MLATPCRCARPHNFDGETCHRCGHTAPSNVTASTWRIAVAIYEALFGYKSSAGGTISPGPTP